MSGTKSRYFIGSSTPDSIKLGLDPEVIVISSFGTTPVNEKACNSYPLEKMLGKNVIDRENLDNLKDSIQGYYDEEKQIIFLHVQGAIDASSLHQSLTEMKEVLLEKGFLSAWSELKMKYARALLFVFSVSHILLYYHPTHVFDTSCIHLFQSLAVVRNKIAPLLGEELEQISGVKTPWIENARLCCPRVLFIFSSQLIPQDILKKKDASKDNQKGSSLKAVEFDLEYRIYTLFRKSRVITNISANSLFELPNNEPYVHVLDKTFYEDTEEDLSTLALRDACGHKSWQGSIKEVWRSHTVVSKDGKASKISSISPLSKSSSANRLSTNILSSITSHAKKNIGHSFEVFLKHHIDEAVNNHFDGNAGRNSGSTFFERPKASVWFEAYRNLHKYMVVDDSPNNEVVHYLKKYMDIDTRFSSVRCSKILPLAIAAYKDGLPAHYSQAEHQAKMNIAINLLANQSRGPAYEDYLTKLEESCEQYWKDGRVGCEYRSLTGNPCHLAKHDPQESSTSHNSGISHVSYCSCGYTRATLTDPYDVKEVNYTFFHDFDVLCCRRVSQYQFPTFSSNIEDAKASTPTKKPEKAVTSESEGASVNPSDSPALATATTLSSGGLDQKTNYEPLLTDLPSQKSEITVNVVDETVLSKRSDKEVSSTEYLPGMMTLASPAGVLPLYSAWALHCLGPSSLYSHNSGINDQPGFLQGTNFLLPWDVVIKIKDKDKWPLIADSMGKKGFLLKNKKNRLGGDLSEFNVKIFLGCEYQCLRGHRFMMASPDKYLKSSSLGHVKDTATKVANSDMPLYYPCQCSRIGNIKYGQLTRLHVVTPKAPVNVTLRPIVALDDSAESKFIPQPTTEELIKLLPSAYWVLRLPFAYEDDNGPYYHADADTTVPPRGKLLKGCYGISEISLDV